MVRQRFAKPRVGVYSLWWFESTHRRFWQCTLTGKRLAWKASVAGNCDGGSSPLTVADVVAKWNEGIWLQPRERGFDSLRHLSMLWSLSGGASAPKADSQ